MEIKKKKKKEKQRKLIDIDINEFGFLNKICEMKEWDLKNYIETLLSMQCKDEALNGFKSYLPPEEKNEVAQIDQMIEELKKRKKEIIKNNIKSIGFEGLAGKLNIFD